MSADEAEVPAGLTTPVLLHTGDGEPPWLEQEPVFYVLSRSGLFLCRNHALFRSCVPTRSFPSELGALSPFARLRAPRLSQQLFEQVVAFFARVAREHDAEAAVHLLWDTSSGQVSVSVPQQTAIQGKNSYGDSWPLGLRYSVPVDLPPGTLLLGDIHSHVYAAAYASGTDVHDEAHAPGLHVVLGRVDRDPPEIHVELVIDGARFAVQPEQVLEGYEARAEQVPDGWMEQLSVEFDAPSWSSGGSWNAGGSWGGSSGGGWHGQDHDGRHGWTPHGRPERGA